MTVPELEAWFKDRELPKELYLNKAVHITDVPACVNSHLEIMRRHGSSVTYSGFYMRLLDIKLLLEAAAE